MAKKISRRRSVKKKVVVGRARPTVRKNTLPRGVTLRQARAHQIAPARLKRVKIEEVDPRRERRIKVTIPRRVRRRKPKVDLGALGLTIHNALRNDVTGYILHVRRKGTLVHVGVWNWAQTPADQGKRGGPSTRKCTWRT